MMGRASATVVLAALLVLLGCSGDDDRDEVAPATTSSSGAGVGTEEPEEAANPFCAPSQALNSIGDVPPLESDPAALREQFTEARDAVAEAEAEAPEEIRADVAVLADGYDQFYEALEAADFDITHLDLADLMVLDSPEMQAASERLDAYRAEAC